jgi:hypothetical protein
MSFHSLVQHRRDEDEVRVKEVHRPHSRRYIQVGQLGSTITNCSM